MADDEHPTTQRYIGQPRKRLEDPRLITGRSAYLDDLHLPDCLYLAIVRSPHAHARIVRIGTEAAQRLPGVAGVFTAADLAPLLDRPLPVGLDVATIAAEAVNPARWPLASGKVRYVGDPVAAVVASGRYLARDAADLVEVEYEPLPAVIDPEQALEAGAPLLFEELGSNRATQAVRVGGDVEAALRKAERVVRLRLVNHRVAPTPLEPRGVAAVYDPGRRELTVWSSTQAPHRLRSLLAEVLGLAENQIRVIAPEVGGAFGSKDGCSPEEALVAALAPKLGRPLTWVEERREGFQATVHGRDQIDEVEAAVTSAGRVTALRVRATADLGAYYQYLTPLIATLTRTVLPGPYDIPAAAFELTQVFTNKTPIGPYRGAGRPEATYLLECLMERVADELGLDPAEVRRRNFIPKASFPYRTPFRRVYDCADLPGALDRALELAGYERLRREQAEARAAGRMMGIGLAAYLESAGHGPWESATVRVEPSGSVTVHTGTSPHGQGGETTMAQIAADVLGVAPEQIVVQHGDTARTPTGIGTFGSRGAAVGGSAVLLAAEQAREKARRIAAHLLEAAPADVRLENGHWTISGARDRSATLTEIAAAAYGGNLPSGEEPGLEATRFFQPEAETYPFGVHLAVVEIDRETGLVDLRRYIAVDDCGPLINPRLAEGQIHGGIAQGVGQALLEQVVYDEIGQLVTGSLMDYALPTAQTLPTLELDHTITPTPRNPLGIKGIGEAGTIAATPAVRNAVLDALAPLGIRELDIPCTAERLWRLLRGAGPGRSSRQVSSVSRAAP